MNLNYNLDIRICFITNEYRRILHSTAQEIHSSPEPTYYFGEHPDDVVSDNGKDFLYHGATVLRRQGSFEVPMWRVFEKQNVEGNTMPTTDGMPVRGVHNFMFGIEYMKKKHSIALMVDQRLGESGRYPFFNKQAHTTTLPAQLALKFDCKIIPIYLERNKKNFFKMEVLKPIEFQKTNDPESDKKIITIKINQIIKKMILRNPGQWIWTHERWK